MHGTFLRCRHNGLPPSRDIFGATVTNTDDVSIQAWLAQLNAYNNINGASLLLPLGRGLCWLTSEPRAGRRGRRFAFSAKPSVKNVRHSLPESVSIAGKLLIAEFDQAPN